MNGANKFKYGSKKAFFLFGALFSGFGSYFLFQQIIFEQSAPVMHYFAAIVLCIMALLALHILLLAVIFSYSVEISDKFITAPTHVIRSKPATICFHDIQKTERIKTYGGKQEIFKITHSGGELIIQMQLCQSKQDFEKIAELVEKGVETAHQKPRILVNGTQDSIRICSRTKDYNNPQWWADLFHIFRNQSKGDASVLAATFQHNEKGEIAQIASMPTSDSNDNLNSELWERLTCIGYLAEAINHQDTSGIWVYYYLTELGKRNLVWLILATKVRATNLANDTTSIADFARQFQTLDRFHESLNLLQLEALREILGAGKEIIAQPGKNQELIFRKYTEIGALDLIPSDQEKWKVTTMGQLVAPFMMDRFIFAKSTS